MFFVLTMGSTSLTTNIQFSILWIFLTLIPVFNLYMEGKVHDLLAERFLYIPSFGLCFLLVGILSHLQKRSTLSGQANIVMISLIFLGLFGYYLYHIRSEVRIYRTASEIARSIPLEVKQKYPVVTRTSFYFENLPDNFHGAYVYRSGVSASMKLAYDLYSSENRDRRAYAYAVKTCNDVKKDGLGKTTFCFRYQNGQLVDKTDELLFFHAPLASPAPQSFRKEDYLLQTGVEFQSPDVGKYLYSGWSYAEKWGRWAVTHESIVLFAVSENRSYTITMSLLAPPLSTSEQVIQVYLNMNHLGDVSLSSQGAEHTVTFMLPVDYLNGNVEVLTFIPRSALSPKELGISPDRRQLSFGIQYIAIEKND